MMSRLTDSCDVTSAMCCYGVKPNNTNIKKAQCVPNGFGFISNSVPIYSYTCVVNLIKFTHCIVSPVIGDLKTVCLFGFNGASTQNGKIAQIILKQNKEKFKCINVP
ncbi:hypothetical protein ACF0H5_000129 [Mactra antiquata]